MAAATAANAASEMLSIRYFDKLPDEIVDCVLAFVPLASVPSVLATCKLFHAAGGTRRLKLVHRLLDAPFGLTTDEIAHSSTSLDLSNRELGADVSGVCDALRAGAMAGCREVHLNGNAMKAAGVQALCEAISAGALSHCTFLALYKNQIDDVGATALGAVLRAGRLRAVKTLCLNSNEIGCAGVAALATAARHGALASLEKLSLCSNAIGDAGAVELAAAASCGSFASVKYLVLERNAIGERGMRALAGAIFCGAFAAATARCPNKMEHRIFLECNPAPAKPVHEALDAAWGSAPAEFRRAPWGRRNFSLVSAVGIVGFV